nr:unnamed protein product [Callosobruchus analis]
MSEDHMTHLCPQTGLDERKCANCGEGHPANSPTCRFALRRNLLNGFAVLVKRGIDYHSSANAEMQSIEAASAVVNMTGGVPLKITPGYVRCGAWLQEAGLEIFLDCSGPLIVAGDYNSKHQALVTTAILLNNFALTTGLKAKKNLFRADFTNIRGVASNINAVYQHLQTEKPHILSLMETQVGSSTMDSLFRYPGYEIYTRFRRRFGVCVYVNAGLACHREEELEPEGFDIIWLKISLRNHSKFICRRL